MVVPKHHSWALNAGEGTRHSPPVSDGVSMFRTGKTYIVRSFKKKIKNTIIQVLTADPPYDLLAVRLQVMKARTGHGRPSQDPVSRVYYSDIKAPR